jgi:hypothetical protein
MPHPRRRAACLLLAAATLTGLLAGCEQEDPIIETTPTVSTALSASPAAPPAAAAAAAPTCAEVKEGIVRGLVDPYYAYGTDGAPLTEGIFGGEDGLTLAVQAPCVTGVLGGEIGNVTVATIMSSIVDTTGRYWAVMLCRKPADRAECAVQFILDDRDPIESVSVSGGKLTLVYLTRPTEGASAAVAIRRSAVYKVNGSILQEESRVDTPYTP